VVEFLTLGEVPDHIHLDSHIESLLLTLLVEAPHLHTKTIFCKARDWHDAMNILRSEAETFTRCNFVAFPQIRILRYRVDFMAALAPFSFERGFIPFIVEGDGKEYHRDQDLADIEREREIKTETNADVLRFSGGEIRFAIESVGEVLDAYVEAQIVATTGPALLEAQRVLEEITWTACLPMLRNELHSQSGKAGLERLKGLLERMRKAQRQTEHAGTTDT
jgi:very-short-patch-repair endonuclease